MNILDLLNQAGGGDGVAQLGRGLGLDPETSRGLAAQLGPAIAGGARRRAQSEGGLGALLGALEGEAQGRYADRPDLAAAPEAQAEGAAFLDDLLGAPEARGQLARAAAERTGASSSLAEQFLPALAAMAMGALQKQAPDTEIAAMRGGLGDGMDRAGAGIGDLLGALAGGALGGAGSGGAGGLIGNLVGGLLSGGGGSPSASAGGQLGGLLQMLDADGDGTPLDDVLEMVMRR